MKLRQISKPLLENVQQLLDQGQQAAYVKMSGKGDAAMSYDEAVRYVSILVGFMLADKATRDNQDLMKRSYVSIGILYRPSVEETKDALTKFWQALQRRPLEFGSRDVKTMILKYHKFLQQGDAEQWKNVLGQLRDYFSHREESVKSDETETA